MASVAALFHEQMSCLGSALSIKVDSRQPNAFAWKAWSLGGYFFFFP